MSGHVTNPVPHNEVSNGVSTPCSLATLHKVSKKRSLPIPNFNAKKRLTVSNPTLDQLLSTIHALIDRGRCKTPIRLLRPEKNPLFEEIRKELHIPNTKQVKNRTRYLWQQYLESFRNTENEEEYKHLKEMYNDCAPENERTKFRDSEYCEDKFSHVQIEPIKITRGENELGHEQRDIFDDEVKYVESEISEYRPHDNNTAIFEEAFRTENESVFYDNDSLPLDDTFNLKNKSETRNGSSLEKTATSFTDAKSKKNNNRDAGFWEFGITAEDWGKVEEKNGSYSWFMLRELIKLVAAPVFKICLINFTTHRKNKIKKGEPAIVYYGKCKHEGCRQFKFDIIPVEDQFKLMISASGELRHEGKLSSRLSGLERSLAKQELVNKKALAFRSEKILKADAKSVLSGNLLEIRSLDVFRQARAEAAKMMDKHNDDGIDLLLRYREDRDEEWQKNKILNDEEINSGSDEKIIQKIGEPLHIYMYSKMQLKTLLHIIGKKGNKCVLHIDSTGSVVRPLMGDRKTVYYYSGCVNVSGKLLPILDLVSCQHDVASITSFFLQFVQFQKKNFGNKCIFTHVVTDFSTALLPAVILAWNRMSVVAYLKKMYKYCTKNIYTMKGIVTVHLCCSHFMHMASGDLARLAINKHAKKFYLHCIASMINCRTFEEFKVKVQALVVVTKSKVINIEVEKAKRLLEEDISIIDEIEENVNESSLVDNDKNIIYKSSPFYKIGREIEEKFDKDAQASDGQKIGFVIKEGQCNDDAKNILECSKFWDLFLTKYMPYAPLWSGFSIRHSTKEKITETRFSNAPIEGWFKLVKESVLDGTTNLKVGRFVEKLKDRIMSICKELYLDIPTAACNKKKAKKCKKILIDEIDEKCSILSGKDEQIEEMWAKKPTKKATYFLTKFPESEKRKDCLTEQKSEENIRMALLEEATANELYKTTAEKKEKEILSEEHKIEERPYEHLMSDNILCDAIMQKTAKVDKYGPLQVDLKPEDYDSLLGTNWVTGAAIDAVAENMLRIRANFSYYYLSFDFGTMMINGDNILHESSFIKIDDLIKSQYLLLPYSTSITGSHWCLIIADLKNKVVYHFDSIQDARTTKVNVLEKVLNFLKDVNALSEQEQKIDLTEWHDKSSTITYPRQSDSYNCGIFVLYYMLKVVETGIMLNDTIEAVDIQEFRRICSRTLENPDSCFFTPAMSNGLIDSPLFYAPDYSALKEEDKAVLENLTVAYIKNKYMGRFLEKISQKDFASLTGTNWLTSTMVDYCNATFIREGQFCFATGEASLVLQEGRPRFTAVFKPIMTEFSKLSLIFVPYNISIHFGLYVIDLRKKVLTHMDPMINDPRENELKCEKIKEFLRVRNRLAREECIQVDELKYVNVNYPTQKDGHSCGVHVIYYLAELSRKNNIQDLDRDFDPVEFREQLQVRCLRLSLPLSELCLVCGEGNYKGRYQWCQCNLCGRWIHYLCMKTRQTYECFRRRSTTYTCVLCVLHNTNIKDMDKG